MGYYKTAVESSPKGANAIRRNIIGKTLLITSVLTIIISIIITVEEITIAYCELFRDGPFRSLGPTLIVAYLIIPQFIGITINLILQRWLKKRDLLDEKGRKLSLLPVYLFFFNLLLAIILTLVVNISNGNFFQWLHR